LKKKQNTGLLIAACACVVALIAMIVALSSQPRTEQAAFTPPHFEETAQQGIPEVPGDLGWSELDANAYKVSICGVVSVNGNTADIWLTNPESNTVWMKLRVLDAQGNTLGETGIIKPGEYVRSITFDAVPDPGDAVTLKIMAYQPDTYYSEGAVSLNTTISEGGTQ